MWHGFKQAPAPPTYSYHRTLSLRRLAVPLSSQLRRRTSALTSKNCRPFKQRNREASDITESTLFVSLFGSFQ